MRTDAEIKYVDEGKSMNLSIFQKVGDLKAGQLLGILPILFAFWMTMGSFRDT